MIFGVDSCFEMCMMISTVTSQPYATVCKGSTMKTTLKYTLAASAVAALTACGGGGGGGTGSTAATETLYPLSTILANYVNNSTSTYFTVSGSLTMGNNTDALSGSGTYRETTTSSTFNGSSALRKTQTTNGTLIVDGVSEPIDGVAYYYFNSNNQPLGSSSSTSYCVTSEIKSIPMYVAAGQSGDWYTTDCYTNSSRAVKVGTAVTQYSVVYVSEKTADLVMNQTFTDSSGRLTAPGRYVYRINDTGGITFKEQSATITYGDASLSMVIRAN